MEILAVQRHLFIAAQRRQLGITLIRRAVDIDMARLLVRLPVAASCIAILLLPSVGLTQQMTPQVAAGVAVPGSALGEARSPGPALRGSFLIGDSSRRVRLRIAADVAWMPGSQDDAIPASWTGDLRVASLSGSIVIGPRGVAAAPYLAIGGGVQHMRVTGQRNPYGVGGVLHIGAGARIPLGRVVLGIEVTPQLLLNDYATREDLSPGVFWPVLFGVSLR